MKHTVVIEQFKCGPKEKAVGRIEIAENYDGSKIDTPVTIVKGAEEGPTLWVQGGLHGVEMAGIEAAIRIARDTKPEKLKGALIVFPIVNTTAFNARERESPIDNKDLNRVFPGDPEGTFSERLAHKILGLMERNLTESDYFIDLHGGGKYNSACSLIEVRGTGDEVERKSMEIAEKACNPHLRVIARIEERTGPWRRLYEGTIGRELHERIKLAKITVEAGAEARIDEGFVQAHYQGVLNVMKHAGMLEGPMNPPKKGVIRIERNVRVAPTRRGFWHPMKEAGDKVRENEVLATVTDVWGNVVEELRSPFEGMVLYMRRNSLVDPLSGRHGERYGSNVGEYHGEV